MKKILILIFLLSCFLYTKAQTEYYKSEFGPISIHNKSDQELVESIGASLENINSATALTLLDYFTNYDTLEIDTNNLTILNNFAIKVVNIVVNADSALMSLQITLDTTILRDELLLQKFSKKWLVTKSIFLTKFLLERKYISTLIDPPKEVSYISELKLSSSALIQIYAWGTDHTVINQNETRDHLNRYLFDTPTSGAVVMTASGDILTVVADETWKRIIYGHKDGDYIKSYGDNAGDYSLYWPRNIHIDYAGNIFLFSESPAKIVRLFYNGSSISYQSTINISSFIQEPVDLDLDDGNDLFVADRSGNAIYELDLNGNQKAKYTTIYNTETEELITLNHPTLIANSLYGEFMLAIVDLDGRRLTIIPSYPVEIQGELIKCKFTSVTFTAGTNVKLSSLSNMEGALWAADKQNTMFHIFSNSRQDNAAYGYLGSIKQVNGIDQWLNPQGFFGAWMSDNYNQIPLGGMTIDNWTNTTGINTYLFGTDIIEPRAIGSIISGVPTIKAKFGLLATPSMITKKLYRNGSELSSTNIPYMNPSNASWIYRAGEIPAIGMYNLTITGYPQYNYSHYPPQWQQTPITKAILFAFPMSGSINGPSGGTINQTLTYTCPLNSGSGVYMWHWYSKPYNQGTTWTDLGVGPIKTINGISTAITLKCTVYDLYNNTYIDFYKNVFSNTVSGIIAVDEVWSGNITLQDNIVINPGVTLTIEPGVEVTMPGGVSIIALGSLNAVGTSENHIRFVMETEESAIIFDVNEEDIPMESIIEYADIINGGGIHCYNYSSIVLRNNTIENAHTGIYIFYCSPLIIQNNIINPILDGIFIDASGYELEIYENTIIKDEQNPNRYLNSGIYVTNGSKPFIYKNRIEGFEIGIDLNSGTTSYLTNNSYDTPNYINNLLTFNVNGLKADNSTLCLAGSEEFIGSFNNITNNIEYGAMAFNESQIYAQQNFWGHEEPNIYFDGSSFLDASIPLDYDPWEGIENSISKEVIEDYSGGRPKIKEGILYEKRGQINNAIRFYKSLIAEQEDIDYALIQLTAIRKRYAQSHIKQYFESLIADNEPYRAKVLNLLSIIYLENKDYNGAINLLNTSISIDSSTIEATNARFQKFYIALNCKKDFTLAEQYLSELEALNLNDPDFIYRLQICNYLFSLKTMRYKKVNVNDPPLEYRLYLNYPNPFNPSTTIQFSIPEDVLNVKLIIYSALGEKVAELVNTGLQAGVYKYLWDASKYASGIYIYQLVTEKFVSTKKMILLK